jgi:hypothetical protein
MKKSITIKTSNGYSAVSIFSIDEISISREGQITVLCRQGHRHEVVLREGEEGKDKFRQLVAIAFEQD